METARPTGRHGNLARRDAHEARGRAGQSARRLVEMDKESSMFLYTLNRRKLRTVRRREGCYLLRTNLTESDPALLWQYYVQLVAVEEAFKNLKGDLAIRPIFHQDERRIEAHILHRVPGLLLVHHPTSSPLCLGAGAHGAKRPGQGHAVLPRRPEPTLPSGSARNVR